MARKERSLNEKTTIKSAGLIVVLFLSPVLQARHYHDTLPNGPGQPRPNGIT